MPKKCETKPEFVLAGPGAGKTHGMVEKVVECLSTLEAHRHAVVVTYTHAATRVIRERLAGRIALPRNVFVGTTHSFVARYILKPYGTHIGGLPNERVYSAVSLEGKPPKARNSILKAIEAKGVVDYGKMLSIAAKIVSDKRVQKQLGERLQFLFIDEFQDISPDQLNILTNISEANRTAISVVGDPEQFISSFTYAGSGRKRPEAHKLPFRLFQSTANEMQLVENHRCNGELVRFANQFRDDLVQESLQADRGVEAVHFLLDTDLESLVLGFRNLADTVESVGNAPERLYLSKNNACFDAVREKLGIIHIGSNMRRGNSLHCDAREFIANAMSCTERAAIELAGSDILAWRSIACRLLQRCKEDEFTYSDFNKFLKKELGKQSSTTQQKHFEGLFHDLKGAVNATPAVSGSEISSSINKAKGLQADAVLVVAKNEGELRKFLETDRIKREADKADFCRLGYVASTRARELLCFGCIKAITSSTHTFLKSLGIAVQPKHSKGVATSVS